MRALIAAKPAKGSALLRLPHKSYFILDFAKMKVWWAHKILMKRAPMEMRYWDPIQEPTFWQPTNSQKKKSTLHTCPHSMSLRGIWCFTRFHQVLSWSSCCALPLSDTPSITSWFEFHRTIRPVFSWTLDTLSSVRLALRSNTRSCCRPYDRMRALVAGISNPMTALRRSSSSSSAPSMTWLQNGPLVFDLGGPICLWICLINSFIGLAFDECFCFLATLDLSVSCSISWLKGKRPGTRTLAACRQKKTSNKSSSN